MAALKGGGDHWDLRPVEATEGEVLGTHKGPYEALNVRNAQPGWHYRYVSTKRDGSFIQKALNEGYEFVMDDDPEKWGVPHQEMPQRVQAAMDGIRAFGDVALMRTPLENWDKLRKQKEEVWLAQQGTADEAFLNAGEENAAMAGGATKGRPLHFRTADHQVGFVEEDK